jgi:hypothetical protein
MVVTLQSSDKMCTRDMFVDGIEAMCSAGATATIEEAT